MIRIARVTPRAVRVAAVLALVAAGAAPARGEETRRSIGADLRHALRAEASVEERVAAARRALEAESLEDVDAAVRLAGALAGDARGTRRDVAAELLLRARRAGGVSSDALDGALRVATTAPPGAPGPGDVAYALAAGARTWAGEHLLSAEPTPLLLDALAFDAPELTPAKAAPAVPAEAWATHVAAAELLDAAVADDPKVCWPALDELVAKKDATFALLLATAAPPGDLLPTTVPLKDTNPRTPAGLAARRVRAIVALGAIGDRRATGVLARTVENDHDDGWARAAAATAIGDLGDPAALKSLCHVLFYLGDLHRLFDSWDYPGLGNTDVPEARWSEVNYMAVDSAVADALLKLGVRNAGEWLARERLVPATGRWRIRVLQDAVDAIRRAFPDAPRTYRPDGGIPDRDRAAKELLAWFAQGRPLARPLDEKDPAVHAAVKALVEVVGQKSVMELQIAKRSIALLGPVATTVVLEAIPAATRKVQRAELTWALGAVKDRRAVGPLLALTRDPVANVRAVAAEALAVYVAGVADPTVAGATDVPTDDVVRRWIEMLDDEEEGPRASATKALAAAPPRADVRAAVEAHASAAHPENAFGDYQMAERVARLVQTGEGLDAVVGLLTDKDLYKRRFVWELLRVALVLPGDFFDPSPDPVGGPPGGPKARPPDVEGLRRALSKRRAT